MIVATQSGNDFLDGQLEQQCREQLTWYLSKKGAGVENMNYELKSVWISCQNIRL